MELVYIFCNPLLHNIIQVKCLTLYEYASVKVISLKKKKKKSDPHLTSYAELGRHSLVVSEPRFRCFWKSLGLGGSGIEYIYDRKACV